MADRVMLVNILAAVGGSYVRDGLLPDVTTELVLSFINVQVGASARATHA